MGAVIVVLFGASGAWGRSETTRSEDQRFAVYAALTTAQFINHADDRVRGMSENPFTPSLRDVEVPLESHNEKAEGPFPGDDVLYTYTLYANQLSHVKLGSALYTCYFNFSRQATCDAYITTAKGVLLASGEMDFNATSDTLAILGGTAGYAEVQGELTATGTITKGQRLAIVLRSPSAVQHTTSNARDVTVFGVATAVQDVDNSDDELRGEKKNPFEPSTTHLAPKLSFVGGGPFPGDVVVYTFKLYQDSAFQKLAGAGSVTCYFNYVERAFCQADYDLDRPLGVIIAAGPVNFKTDSFSLVITGGTGRYLAAQGQLVESPLGKGQRLAFELPGAA